MLLGFEMCQKLISCLDRFAIVLPLKKQIRGFFDDKEQRRQICKLCDTTLWKLIMQSDWLFVVTADVHQCCKVFWRANLVWSNIWFLITKNWRGFIRQHLNVWTSSHFKQVWFYWLTFYFARARAQKTIDKTIWYIQILISITSILTNV